MPSDQVGLEGGLGAADAAAPFEEREPAEDRGHCGRPVGESMLPQLRELDGRDDRIVAAAHRDRLPGVGRLLPTPEPSEEVRPVHGDPLGGPRGVERGHPWRVAEQR